MALENRRGPHCWCRCKNCVINIGWAAAVLYLMSTCIGHIALHGKAFPGEPGPGYDIDPVRRPYTYVQPLFVPAAVAPDAAGSSSGGDDDPALDAGLAAIGLIAGGVVAGVAAVVGAAGAMLGALGPDAEEIHRLLMRTPGHDGSRHKNRYEKKAYLKEEFGLASKDVRARVIDFCIQVFQAKVDAVKMSEKNFAATIRLMAHAHVNTKNPHPEDLLVAKLLPRTFGSVMSLLDDVGLMKGFMQDGGMYEYDMCRRCHALYRCEMKDADHCTRCATPVPPRLGVHVPREPGLKFTYCTIGAHIQRVYMNEILAKLMPGWAARLNGNNELADATDGDVCRKIFAAMGGDARNVVVHIYVDPFQPYGDNTKYSVAPLVAVIQNFAQHFRWQHAAVHLCCLQAGSSKADVLPDRQDMYNVASDELAYLGVAGVRCRDWSKPVSVTGEYEYFTCLVRLGAVCSDYRGLQDLTKMKGSPTSFACWKCWIPGFSIGPGKTLFSNHFQLLPLSHRFRRKTLKLIRLNNPPPKPVPGGPRHPRAVRRTGRETPARKRTAIEVRKNRLRPYRNPKLVPGEAQCTYDVGQELPVPPRVVPIPSPCAAASGFFGPETSEVPDNLQYDGMHTTGGAVKEMFSMMLGHLPKPNAAVWAYDRIVNSSRASHYKHCAISLQAKARMIKALATCAKHLDNQSRVENLLSKATKTKTHTYIMMTQSIGVYLVHCARMYGAKRLEQPAAQAITGFFRACGDLWCHNVHRDILPVLETRMVEALCMTEFDLSSQCQDVKMHNLTHQPDSIRALGPLPGFSMFPAEGFWGWLKLNARNKGRPEATMQNSFRDKQWLKQLMLTEEDVLAPEYYYKEQFIADFNKISMTPVRPVGKPTVYQDLEDEEAAAAVKFYIGLLPVLGRMWRDALKVFWDSSSGTARNNARMALSVSGGFSFASDMDMFNFFDTKFSADPQKAVRRALRQTESALLQDGALVLHGKIKRYRGFQLGPVLLLSNHELPRSYWVMHRVGLGEFVRPRFGRVRGVITHKGFDRDERCMILVEWYKEASTVYHDEMGVPLCSGVIDTELSSYTEPKDLVPYDFFGMPDMESGQDRWCMLSSHGWHIMRHLGFPSAPPMVYKHRDGRRM